MSFQKKFSYLKKVIESDLDNLNHVNNIEYLKWVQKASTLHWESLSNKELNKKFLWVVLRHEIDYYASAFINDNINVTTYIGDSYGVKSERFVEFIKNGKLLAKSKTIWCLIDKKKMKPIRIPEEINVILDKIKV